MAAKSFPSHLIHLPALSPSPSSHYILFTSYSLFRSPWHSSLISLQTSKAYLYPVSVKLSRTIKCLPKSTEESEPETLASDGDDESGDDLEVGSDQNPVDAGRSEVLNGSRRIVVCSSDYPSHGIREPVYEVMEVQSNGMVSTRRINRRHLLKSSGLRPRDVRSVDPSLWLTNSMPSMLVQALLEVLPNRLTADILEQLRISKQTLVELGSKAGALKQLLLNMLEDPDEIRHISIMGRNCTLNKNNYEMECSVPLEKQIAEEVEEEIEMLFENNLQRCKSCHGQAERLLDSAREMEDSIAVNLRSQQSGIASSGWDILCRCWCSGGRYIWHELKVVSQRTCVCILADNSGDYHWFCCGIFSYVHLSQGTKNILSFRLMKVPLTLILETVMLPFF